ncbi:L,D-transpeptidase [Lichenihabitans sp. Uapishka_5]|uniref:L,D-transpeptidase n=1 Tax=Lichenihabitans sp. Uapishka_5 TaxID=3037302 RepID=UPI0029E7F9E2|nr:L,D-transpeptidase [Lichenihabitans sp. Uapishka_5]MDX7952239.1 L,D-transpeptidase [Lichenihabitans sp. Uapishka_5]
MRIPAWTLVVATMAVAGSAGPAWADGPLVVPAYAPQPGYAPRAAAPDRGAYGGGFIEFVMTGDAGPADRPLAPRAGPYVEPYGARPVRAVDPMFLRQEVSFEGVQSPGTIVIDTTAKFLYLVEAEGRALRYGIGVGRPGFVWHGSETITRMAEWPGWTPPAEMVLRRPDLPPHMDGGIANPLGARAMYLGSSLYRIHGTNEPETIGTNVSSGCIRLTNDDVSDLYSRVRVGTHVVVM